MRYPIAPYTKDPVEGAKVFHIFGWKSDGSPLIRAGVNWLNFDRQTKALGEAIRALPLNEGKFLPFRTVAGEIAYFVKRVK